MGSKRKVAVWDAKWKEIQKQERLNDLIGMRDAY